MNRRTFIKHGIVGGILSLFPPFLHAHNPTPREIRGPFYPVLAQKDKDFDLTQVEGKNGVAKGNIIILQGRVIDVEGKPIEDAIIDLWQANAAGRYNHPNDHSNQPLDPYFQGWAIIPSGKEGRFCFKTVYPGTYRVSNRWTRAPHIHFKVSKNGYVDLTTQMYFPGHPLNNSDRLLQSKNEKEQQLMIASQIYHLPDTYHYDIILQKV